MNTGALLTYPAQVGTSRVVGSTLPPPLCSTHAGKSSSRRQVSRVAGYSGQCGPSYGGKYSSSQVQLDLRSLLS